MYTKECKWWLSYKSYILPLRKQDVSTKFLIKTELNTSKSNLLWYKTKHFVLRFCMFTTVIVAKGSSDGTCFFNSIIIQRFFPSFVINFLSFVTGFFICQRSKKCQKVGDHSVSRKSERYFCNRKASQRCCWWVGRLFLCLGNMKMSLNGLQRKQLGAALVSP